MLFKGELYTDLLAPTFRGSYWANLGGGDPRFCIPNKFPGIADAVILGSHFENHCFETVFLNPGHTLETPREFIIFF